MTADLARQLVGVLAALLLFLGGLLLVLIGEVSDSDWLPRTGTIVAVISLLAAAWCGLAATDRDRNHA